MEIEFKAHFAHLRDKYLSDTKTIAQFTNTSPSQGLPLQAKFVKPIQSFIWLKDLPNSIFVHLLKGEVEHYYERNIFIIQIQFYIIDSIWRAPWYLVPKLVFVSIYDSYFMAVRNIWANWWPEKKIRVLFLYSPSSKTFLFPIIFYLVPKVSFPYYDIWNFHILETFFLLIL